MFDSSSYGQPRALAPRLCLPEVVSPEQVFGIAHTLGFGTTFGGVWFEYRGMLVSL